MAGANAKTLTTAITLLLALGIELANKYGPYWTFRFLIGGLGYPQPSPYERKKAQKAAEKARKAREAEEAEERRREAELRFARELEARAAADAVAKAKAARAAKRAEAKTAEKVDPASVGKWVEESFVPVEGNVVSLSAAHEKYAAYCRAHGQAQVAPGKPFAAELRKLGIEVVYKNNRTEVRGVAFSKAAKRGGLRVAAFSR